MSFVTTFRVGAALKALARRGRMKFERVFRAGNNFACNVCGATARSWWGGRENGRCPTCRCPNRTRTLWWWLQREAPNAREWRILHFAPEAPLERQLRGWSSRQYQTCDLINRAVDLTVDIQRLPLPDASYDLIVCSHVLEHVPDDRAAMRELRRICSPKGRVVIMVPMNPHAPTVEDLSDLRPEERTRRFGQFDHLRQYGTDFVAILGTAGLDVQVFEPGVEIDSSQRSRLGLAVNEQIFVCSPRT